MENLQIEVDGRRQECMWRCASSRHQFLVFILSLQICELRRSSCNGTVLLLPCHNSPLKHKAVTGLQIKENISTKGHLVVGFALLLKSTAFCRTNIQRSGPLTLLAPEFM